MNDDTSTSRPTPRAPVPAPVVVPLPALLALVALASSAVTALAMRAWSPPPPQVSETRPFPVCPPPPLCPRCEAVTPPPPPPPPPPVDPTWSANALSHRGENGRVVRYRCSPRGTPRTVWGTEIYTDDSSVCTAAVHAGLITLSEGGEVTIEIRPGRRRYEGSTHHGISTTDYAEWQGSFVFRASR